MYCACWCDPDLIQGQGHGAMTAAHCRAFSSSSCSEWEPLGIDSMVVLRVRCHFCLTDNSSRSVKELNQQLPVKITHWHDKPSIKLTQWKWVLNSLYANCHVSVPSCQRVQLFAWVTEPFLAVWVPSTSIVFNIISLSVIIWQLNDPFVTACL